MTHEAELLKAARDLVAKEIGNRPDGSTLLAANGLG